MSVTRFDGKVKIEFWHEGREGNEPYGRMIFKYKLGGQDIAIQFPDASEAYQGLTMFKMMEKFMDNIRFDLDKLKGEASNVCDKA